MNHTTRSVSFVSVLLTLAVLLCSCSTNGSIAGFLALSSDMPAYSEADEALAAELTAAITRQDGDYDPYLGEPVVAKQPSLAAMMTTVAATAQDSLLIPGSFAIARPDKALQTSDASYFITGVSNPGMPVYFEDTEIQRLGTLGTFGVHVELEMGENIFRFRQGDRTETVVITRPPPAGTPKIADIRQSSMAPSVSAGVVAGKSFSVGCIAPAGAEITATFDGSTVRLTQDNPEIKNGYPAVYTGKIAASGNGVDPDETKLVGKVDYTMTFDGQTKKYTSDGDVYVAGDNSRIAVEVVGYLGFVYPDLADLSQFKETVKAGARDYITGQTNEYYKLSSGGSISKSQVAVVTGKGGVANQLGDASYTLTGNSESITFHGTRSPFYVSWIADNTLYLRLYNTSGTPVPAVSGSALLASCSASAGEGDVTYQFPLKGQVWGYDVALRGNDTVLTVRRKPALSQDAQAPLTGVTIVVDPGHGGSDPGALGTAGTLGPTEADVNLANALATGNRLAQLGANVIMTRTEDGYLSLDDRMKVIEDYHGDFFISLHHNSVAESTDANKVDGLEVYYHTSLSKRFADTMMNSLSQGLGRKNRKVEQSYYRVTLMTYSPALLLELGFMPNPLEYEKATIDAEISRVADSIASGILAALQ